MKEWLDTLQEMAIPLLEQSEDRYYSFAKYYLLREIFEKPPHDPEVSGLRETFIKEIMGKQLENGSWNNKVYDYEEGTTHQLMNLLDLGVSNTHESIKKAATYMWDFQSASGAFVQAEPSCSADANLIETNAVVMGLARAGYGDDSRLLKAAKWLCSWQQKDGSWISPDAKKRRELGEGYPYPYCGIHATCNTLLGLSTVSKMKASEPVKKGATYLLGLFGYKYLIDDDLNPPCYSCVPDEAQRVPYEGAWYDPRIIPPEDKAILQQEADRKVEVLTTQHVLGTLGVLGYQLNHEKVKKGLSRLLQLVRKEDVSLYTLMVIKQFYKPFCAYSFHGH